jgi:hypothetical protein
MLFAKSFYMPKIKKRATRKDGNALKGSGFENSVREILDEGCQCSGGRLTYKSKPKLMLQNREIVIPDFVVQTVSSHEKRHFYIECQNRQRSTKSILHKIQHIRSKHIAKTFIYVYRKNLGSELKRAFESESIVAHNLAQFRYYIQEMASFIYFGPMRDQMVRATSARSRRAYLPRPEKNVTSLNSHPNAKKLIDEFLSRESSERNPEKTSGRDGERIQGSPSTKGHGHNFRP